MASPDSLRAVITDLHAAIADHQDPQAKAEMTQCLTILMKIQARDHQQASQNAGAVQSVLSQLGAQQGG